MSMREIGGKAREVGASWYCTRLIRDGPKTGRLAFKFAGKYL